MRLKKLLITLILLISFNTLNAGPFGGGDGKSEATAYELYTRDHIYELVDSMLNYYYLNNGNIVDDWSKGKYFKIMNNISEPITRAIGRGPNFQGHIDGGGFRIRLNLTDGNSCQGLFGATDGATIKNIVVSGYVEGNTWVGAIVGEAKNTTISNCVNLAKVKGYWFVGSIVGAIDNLSISNCINLGTVIVDADVMSHTGGIAGCSSNTSINISNCINAGYIKGNGKHIGGILGHEENNEKVITNCISIGVIEGPEDTTGGILGK